ncbi:MAG: hypothetical protein JWO37_2633 [Acidimicrobiales bacterium]|nr:hypothetical protein [Acidimicrobiales bacterium]
MTGMSALIDADQHLFERRDTWREFIDPAQREDALAIEDDELGWSWLTWRGRRLYLAESQTPADARRIGATRVRVDAGLPPEDGERFDEAVPPEYHDPAARVAALDRWGLDEAVLFPNFGLLWETMLGVDLPALTANMRAANRWQAAARHDGGGRLNPVGHLTLRDAEWAEEEIANLAGAGIRLAMIGPAPVNGKPLSDPSLDRIWSAFVHHGVSPVFHVSGFEPPLHPAWYSTDKEPVDSVMGSVFLWVAPAVAVADMTINGVFERHPELRLGIVELSANWVPMFLLNLDGASDFYALRHGGPLMDLPLRPSEYVKRNVRVSVLAYERPAHLVERVSDEMFMYGSDWPHAEGIADPLGDYTRQVERLDDERRGRLLGDNVAWLLHR